MSLLVKSPLTNQYSTQAHLFGQADHTLHHCPKDLDLQAHGKSLKNRGISCQRSKKSVFFCNRHVKIRSYKSLLHSFKYKGPHSYEQGPLDLIVQRTEALIQHFGKTNTPHYSDVNLPPFQLFSISLLI